jgi:hypothetical protein
MGAGAKPSTKNRRRPSVGNEGRLNGRQSGIDRHAEGKNKDGDRS